MIRIEHHNGASMDAENYATGARAIDPRVVKHVQQVKKEGMGVISNEAVGGQAGPHQA